MMLPPRVCPFAGLEGWGADDLDAALAAYRLSAGLPGLDWPLPDGGDARQFFESAFRPQAADPAPGLLTGYHEPVLHGRLQRGPGFEAPLYRLPERLPANHPWHSRAEIEDGDLLRGHEIAWLASPLEAFFVQVQGSARVVLEGGRHLRLGYAGRNGHAYRSIGAELVRRGAVASEAISAQAIRAWCEEHPDEVAALLRVNPSFVFFRALDLPQDSGPIGALGCPVTPGRSLAVDPDLVPLGAPVWVEADGAVPFRRLMVAQDTGSAIRGPNRGDAFCGWGPEAAALAGGLRTPVRLVVLLPRGRGAVQ